MICLRITLIISLVLSQAIWAQSEDSILDSCESEQENFQKSNCKKS
jgi:hypothetical protein